MVLFRLAEQLCIWDVRRLEREMPMDLFHEWLAYLNIKAEREREARQEAKMEAGAEQQRRNAKKLL